jgi:hypothetical protein
MAFYIACAIAAAAFSQAEIAAVYQPLLRERYHGTSASQMVVKDTSLPMPTLRGSLADWLKQFDEVPHALTRAASQPSPKESRRLEASMFPTGTRLVSATTVEAAFRGSGIEEKWSAFRGQFGAQGWVAFSEALATDDQLNALVYYEARCGGMCGEGGYAWLHRGTTNSPWRVAKKIISWMS